MGSAKGAGFCHATRLFPLVFALHVAEEAPRFTAWARRYGSDSYTRTDFVRDNSLGMAQAVSATVMVRRWPNRPVVFAYFATVVSQQAANAFFHLGATAAYRSYAPGVVTSAALVLPLWWRLTRLALGDGRLTRRGAVGAASIGGLIHAGVVAKTVFKFGHHRES